MLKDRTAPVTGPTSGIGPGIAQGLAAQGANVILHGFGDPAAMIRLKDELAERHGVRVGHDGADMRRPEAIEAVIVGTLADFGCIGLLINNAGVQHVAPVDECPVEQRETILAINLTAVFHTTRLALPAMKRRGFGRIVNIASAPARVASPCKSAASLPGTAWPGPPGRWRSKWPKRASRSMRSPRLRAEPR